MTLYEAASFVKALADESRLRALSALRAGELCVCDLVGILGLAPSTVSKHMSILRQAGLVEARKDGRWMHYSLPGRGGPALARKAIELVTGEVTGDPIVKADGVRAKAAAKRASQAACDRTCG